MKNAKKRDAPAGASLVDVPWHRTVRRILQAGRNVLIVGEPGVGKSSFASSIAREMTGLEPEVVQGTPETDGTHIWGFREIVGGETGFSDGPLPRALKEGRFLLIEDWSLIPYGVRDNLLALRDQPVVTNPHNKGERIAVPASFRLIATSNPESMACRRNLDTAQALHDGFIIWTVPALDGSQVEKVLRHHHPGLAQKRLERAVSLWSEFRSVGGKKGGDDKKQLRLSLRAALHLVALLEEGFDEPTAIEAALVNAYAIDPDAHEAARSILGLRHTADPFGGTPREDLEEAS